MRSTIVNGLLWGAVCAAWGFIFYFVTLAIELAQVVPSGGFHAGGGFLP